jgi:hypothetical protein
MEVPVVGQRERIHAVLLAAFDEFSDVTGAIEQAVMAVAVEVDKGPGFGLAFVLLRHRCSLL